MIQAVKTYKNPYSLSTASSRTVISSQSPSKSPYTLSPSASLSVSAFPTSVASYPQCDTYVYLHTLLLHNQTLSGTTEYVCSGVQPKTMWYKFYPLENTNLTVTACTKSQFEMTVAIYREKITKIAKICFAWITLNHRNVPLWDWMLGYRHGFILPLEVLLAQAMVYCSNLVFDDFTRSSTVINTLVKSCVFIASTKLNIHVLKITHDTKQPAGSVLW